MRRNKRKERLEASTSTSIPEEDHDLAYFIHDRVELMRQVFSALKPKEIKAMAPASVRKLSDDELEELCLEELLGISSKRLCAVLDGAEPPSDTESSSDSDIVPKLPTIELDSSDNDDEGMHSRQSNKNKKKKRKRKNKNKSQPGDAVGVESQNDDRTSAWGRGSAGLTVLELLELQARARALKAQLLAAEHGAGVPASPEPCPVQEARVKEEQDIVVEISSDEDKPNVSELRTREAIEPTPSQSLTTNKRKDSLDDHLRSLLNVNLNTGKATTTTVVSKKNKLKNNAQNSVKNKNKSKDNTENKNINNSKDSAVQSSCENKASDKTNHTQKVIEHSNKKMNNQILELTARKKISETQKCSGSIAKEKEGAKKNSKKNKKKAAEMCKENTEDGAKKNEESIVDAKAQADDVTIVIEDDEPEPSTQKSPIRPPSPPAAAHTSNFTIHTPQQLNTKRTIQLDRNNVVISLSTERATRIASAATTVRKLQSSVKKVQRKGPVTPNAPKINSVVFQAREKQNMKEEVTKKKVNKRKKSVEDRDEITLQLSDSEKMDLLEDLDRSALDEVSSSSAGSSVSDDDSGDDYDGGKDQGDEVSVDSDEVSSTVLTIIVEDDSEKVEERVGDIKHKRKKGNMVEKTPTEVDVVKESEKVDEYIPNDTVIDSTTHENDVIETNVTNLDADTKDTSDEESIVSTEKEAPIRTESMFVNIDEINKQNINTNNGNIIEVTCINDIPIKPDNNNLKLPDDIQDTAKIDDGDKNESLGDSSENTEAEEKEQGYSENNLGVTKEYKFVDNQYSFEENDKEKVEETIPIDKEIIETRLHLDRIPSEEGELSDKSSSGVEAFDMKLEVVCISDDDGETHLTTLPDMKKAKKNKKQKKCKKHKKNNEKLYKDADRVPGIILKGSKTDDGVVGGKQIVTEVPEGVVASADNETSQTVTVDSDDVYEILELSDDSSCFEVEGVSVLSKEPTSEEIVALSAKIDEMERQDVITDQDIIEHEQQISSKPSETGMVENISWKDRYLDSKKVKKVLTTSNILNAMRKKNIELKKKMLEAKQKEAELEEKELEVVQKETPPEEQVEEGSIEHFNTLQGSNKYVDPVPDKVDSDKEESSENNEKYLDTAVVNENEQSDNIQEVTKVTQETITKEVKKDAKQLLKMYKRLLKYNDMNKPKEPNKKKKHKKQKKKKDGGGVAGVATCDKT